MDWVKETTDYYRRVAAIAMGSDALEVMYTRGKSLAGEIELSGFIPDALVHTLARKPGQATRLAGQLVKADLWERVPGGYQIVGWAEDQADLEKHVEKKRRDKERKRRDRLQAKSAAVSAPVSVDASVDSPAPRPVDASRAAELEVEKDSVPQHCMTVTGGARPESPSLLEPLAASCNEPLRGVS